MKLRFLGTTSGNDSCPNLYETDRGTYIVQGHTVTDPSALAALHDRGMPDGEAAVEIPKALLSFAQKAG
jgi:hypothetical protein